MKSLILLRGLPGSGKSTLAKILSEENKYPVLSIDSFFTDPITGLYQFDPYKNHLAYKNCEEQTELALKNGTAKVFVDNTFTIEWEMENYFKLAATYNYKIFVVTVENRHQGKNQHNVSQEQLTKMAEKYKVQLL
jgi:predicted kinase